MSTHVGTAAPARSNAFRVFTIGGLISFRALFSWLNPWVYIPSLLIAPIFQILLFAFMGRSAGVGNDEFYVVGNAVQYSAIPCVFAMSQAVAGERWTQTLGLVLTSPASRVALFLGRALPVIANGWFVSMFSLIVGGALLGVVFAPAELARIALLMIVASVSCTGIGLVFAAISLIVRQGAVANNVVFGILLIFTGANVALSSMPGWVATIGRFLPLTHSIEACRAVADGAALSSVAGQVGDEVAIAVVTLALGLLMLRILEQRSRARASLEMM